MRVSGRLEGLRTTNNSNNDNIIFQQKDKHFQIYEKNNKARQPESEYIQ